MISKDINNLADLQLEIRVIKQRIRETEVDMEDRWKRLPQETVKATIGSIIPLFLNNAMASGTWNVLKGVTHFFKRKKENADSLKEEVIEPAKKLGVFAVLKMLYGFIQKKE